MRIKLFIRAVSQGGWLPKMVEMEGAELSIGRKMVDLQLDDPYCSTTHALIYEDDDGIIYLRDLGSTNGTFVEAERIRNCPIFRGTEFQVGRTRIQVVSYSSTPMERTCTIAKKRNKGKGTPCCFAPLIGFEPNQEDPCLIPVNEG